MKKAGLLAAVVAFGAFLVSPVCAQFNQVIVFGDSNVDSGFYQALSSPGASGANYNASWPAAVAHGAGAPTSSPSAMNVQVLASHYGLTTTPANTSGGTNYATSGAKNVTINSATTGGFQAAVPTVTQIQNYLNANSGVANAQALFVIWSGDNDVTYANGESGSGPPSDPNAYVVQAANDLAAKIVVLRNAGARHLIVSGLAYGFPTGSGNATKRALKLTYTNTLWNALDSAGVSFARSNIETVREDIVTNRVAYGFDYVDTAAGHMACNPVIPNPSGSGTVTISTAWSLLCSSDPGAPSQFLTTTAPETMLFADDQHLAGKGQRIVGNYLIQIAAGLPSAKRAHDFNGDAKSDIFWRNTGGSNALWLMNGAAVSSVALLGGVDTSWVPVGQRDFDGDGKADILWRNSGGSNAIWFMDGATVTSVSLIGGVATSWAVVGTADLNGDGKGDIIWRNTEGTVAVWLMNGATASSVAVLGGIGTNWSVAGTADFNGDGKSDILWRENGGSNAVWFMNGASIASVSLIGGVGTSWTVAGTGDFNGDGKGDILWREAGGSNAVWFMNGASVSSVALIGGVGTTWSVASVGDYNGDGKSDILWREAGGTNAIWLMNGPTVSSVSLIGGVASNWAVQNAGAN